MHSASAAHAQHKYRTSTPESEARLATYFCSVVWWEEKSEMPSQVRGRRVFDKHLIAKVSLMWVTRILMGESGVVFFLM